MTTQPDADTEPFMEQSIFEGLFVRSLKPEGQFAEDLQKIGYDRRWPKNRYHAKVWLDALEVAHRHVFPNLPRAEAHQKLGRLFVEGYQHTIMGRVMAVAVPFLKLETLLKQMPASSRRLSSAKVTVHDDGGGAWRLSFEVPYSSADFSLGMMQVVFANLATVELLSSSANGYELAVRETKNRPSETNKR